MQVEFRKLPRFQNVLIEDVPELLRQGKITIPASLKAEQKIFFEFLSKNRIEISKGGVGTSAAAMRGVSVHEKTDVHDAKYTSWMSAMQHIRTEGLMSLDWDHINPLSELWFIPNAMKEFAVDERLAGGPYNSDIFTRPISKIADSFGFFEEGWLDGELPVKDEIDAPLYYGKGFKRVGYLRNHEMLSGDESVQEDALG